MSDSRKQPETKTELKANIALIIIGIIGGSVFFFINNAVQLSSIFFSIALGSILYQFLGGIGDNNSLQLGVIKFGGSAAVLAGFIYLLITYVFETKEVVAGKISYSTKNWIPISSETGKILNPPLFISNGTTTDTFPNGNLADARMNHMYSVTEKEDGKFTIYTPDKSESIGYFDISNISSNSLFNNIIVDQNETSVQVFTLYPDDPKKSSSKQIIDINIPFEISTFNQSRFSISMNDRPLKQYENREVVPRTSYIVPISDNEIYVAFLEQGRSVVDENNKTRFSKWLVKRFKKTFGKKAH